MVKDKTKKNMPLNETIILDNEVTAKKEIDIIAVKGPKGEVRKRIVDPKITIAIENNKITLEAIGTDKKNKKILNTFIAHIKNMVHGVKEPYVYKLKICSGHFPMNVAVEKGKLNVKNLLGEKTPRVLQLKEGVNVKVDGQMITVDSPDIEKAGQVAADIEELTKRPSFDTRVFQDGIYIIEKAGRQVK